jgi:hypothetical protein
MKLNKSLFIALFALPLMLLAQEPSDSTAVVTEDTIAPPVKEYERAAFQSTGLIDNQTDRVFSKGTIEMTMNHRFGLVNGSNDMIGIWAPANIRIALSYAVTDRITVGFGTTKDSRLLDFNLKGAIFKQTRNGSMPVNVSYYGNFTTDARKKENFYNTSDRWSFFNQIIISRYFSKAVSFQIAPSYSHYNRVARTMKNDMAAIAIGGKVTIFPDIALLVESSVPLMTYELDTPEPGFGVGLEYGTVGHAFQLFISNSKGIINQQNYMYNQNEFFNGEFMIGFNITRSW